MVLVRYFAAARAAAGVTEEKIEADSLGAVVEAVVSLHGERLARVLTACSFLVDGLSSRDLAAPLQPGATVDVLPPFAGG
ncbi:molybdopterin synthase sulfur carrier subunit [Virgisporangium aliadipatigenens]|uniref:Molybdopterin synthase sulfur carrier subunit n=1 Tax=Virgisporangium aliadipatigenens TaxID=741659 RepID=A0A8J4DUU6_9ACTN|nr:MoaD/ThiS family protein [Virgisporangium aliadipatigenens]GIJ50771.1 molybdopterin synthase sulfur carrier subunit [Virgisporangium aliadipatigenens]